MAGRGIAKTSLGKVCKRAPTVQWRKLLRFRDENGQFASLVPKLTDFFSRINWSYYRATMRLEFVRLIDEIDRRYQVLTKTIETDIKTLSKEHTAAAKAKSAEVKEVNTAARQSKRRIKEYAEERTRLVEMKPYRDMTIGEFCILRPDKALYIPHQTKSLFWPHTPDDQKPGPVGTPELKEDAGEMFVFGGDVGEATTIKPFAGSAAPTMPIEAVVAESERIEKRLAVLKAVKPTAQPTDEDKSGVQKPSEAKADTPGDDKDKRSREKEIRVLETTLASLRQAMTEAHVEQRTKAKEEDKLIKNLPSDVKGIKDRLAELRAKEAVASLNKPKETHSEEVELSVVKPQNAEIALLEAKLAQMTSAAAKEESAPIPMAAPAYRAVPAQPAAAKLGEMKPTIIEGLGGGVSGGDGGNVDVTEAGATIPMPSPKEPVIQRSVKPAQFMSVHTEFEELETGEVRAPALQPDESKKFAAKLGNAPLPVELRSAERHPAEALETGEVRATALQPHESKLLEPGPAAMPVADTAVDAAKTDQSPQLATKPTQLATDELKSMQISSEAEVVKAEKCEVTISADAEAESADKDKISTTIVKCTDAQFASLPVKIDELTIEAKMMAIKLANAKPAIPEPCETESAKAETAATEQAEAVPAEAKPAKVKGAAPIPFEIHPIEVESPETEPAEIDQAKDEPADIDEAATESANTKCAEVNSLPARHDELTAEAKMIAVKLAETKPVQAESVEAKSRTAEQAERAETERADCETAESKRHQAESAATEMSASKSKEQSSSENKSDCEVESPNKNR